MKEYDPGSPAIEVLAQRIAAAGGIFEMIQVDGSAILCVIAPMDDPTRPGKTYECELATEACPNITSLHTIHRAIERLVAKAAQRLGVK